MNRVSGGTQAGRKADFAEGTRQGLAGQGDIGYKSYKGRRMSEPSPNLEQLLAARLEAGLGDPAVAGELASLLTEEALTWRAPVVELASVRAIIGFTFGNRMLANGNREPGPVNEALADLVLDLHAATGAPVWAQWEVAEPLAARLPAGVVTAIHPARDAHAEPLYLNTGGVIEAVIARAGGAEALGPVAVVAQRDHAWRCVTLCRRHGLTAGVVESRALPGGYDALSGQPWTRSRLAYLLHDLHCRMLDRRDALLAGNAPGALA